MRLLTNSIHEHVGEKIELAGWVHARRDHGKIIFIDLRDRGGVIQVVFTPKVAGASDLRSEYVIQLTGMVKERPASMVNDKVANGNLEIEAETFTTLATAETPPFPLDSDGHEIKEEIRMKYRYLDLRRKRMIENLDTRSRVIKFMRDFLIEKGFIEIETPILSKSTPEGARDYLVPSRIKNGNFYALPQSPQQYKQLLMVGGVEKYFQIARCFRDEDTRGDRQPEFTQLDIEMSFVNKQEDILSLIEELYISLIKKLFPQKRITGLVNGKIPKLKYDFVMDKYNSDKPDLRENKDDPDELALAFITDFPMFEKKDDGSLGAVHHPFTLPTFNTDDDTYPYNHDSKEYGTKLRDMLANYINTKSNESEILNLKAYQYDMVCNGFEVGGGSIRIHDPYLLNLIFQTLGHEESEVKRQFGHILEAFKYGVPPHGGIAPGIDRFIMILQNEPNIREVIAFPKSGDGYDFMMDAPSEVDPKQLKELGIELKKKN